jgi:hypothetical protein
MESRVSSPDRELKVTYTASYRQDQEVPDLPEAIAKNIHKYVAFFYISLFLAEEYVENLK